jgi:16S rRNA G966 N2-methylase RsmD
VTELHGLKLAWRQELEGGGRGFGQDFIPVVAQTFGRVRRLFELCAGPGYVGFSLLAHDLCDELVLGDINPAAIEVLHETVRMNGLEDRVTIYETDALDSIPAEEHERWDLVVVNPPHFPDQVGKNSSLVLTDPGWDLHRRFFRDVGKFLAPGGSALLLESSEGSTPDDFLPMIEDGGLSHIRTLWYSGSKALPIFYFLWVKPGLPAMSFDDSPLQFALPVSDPPGESLQVPAGRPSEIEVVNAADRPVRPQVFDGDGNSQLWRPIDRIPPGEKLRLPVMALKPGDYEVRDRVKGVTVGRVVAS